MSWIVIWSTSISQEDTDIQNNFYFSSSEDDFARPRRPQRERDDRGPGTCKNTEFHNRRSNS